MIFWFVVIIYFFFLFFWDIFSVVLEILLVVAVLEPRNVSMMNIGHGHASQGERKFLFFLFRQIIFKKDNKY